MRLSSTVFEILRVICRNSPTSTYPTCIWRPSWGWPRSNFENIFGSRNWSPWAIVRRCLRVPMFSHFSRTPTRDRHTHRQTHRQTHDHGIYRAVEVYIPRAVKICSLYRMLTMIDHKWQKMIKCDITVHNRFYDFLSFWPIVFTLPF